MGYCPTSSVDYFTDNDYFPPQSPGLVPINPRLHIDNVEEDGLSYLSNDELNLNSPWVSAFRSTLRHEPENTKHSFESVDEEESARWLPSRKDEASLRELASRVLLETKLGLGLASKAFQVHAALAIAAEQRARNTRVRKRLALPIVIKGENGPLTVMACPDTGSDDNIVSLELTERLQLQLKLVEEDKEFSLANGKIIKPLGEALIRCSFGIGNAADTAILECKVYVFESLAVPAIIGAEFLEETETFTKHRDRFVEQIVPSMQALRVNSVGKPRRGLVCCLDNFVGCANADTGSDLDLVNPQFANQRGFNIGAGVEELEFADGSIGYTSGVIKASFVVGNVDAAKGFVPRGARLDLEFFVLDSLTSDIVVGQDTLEELNVFNQHSDSFIDSLPQPGQSNCNIIRHIGTVESAIKSTLKSIKNMLPDRTDRNSVGPSDAIDRDNEREQLLAIQRENAQREGELSPRVPSPYLPNSVLSPVSPELIIAANPAGLVGDGMSMAGSFVCTFEGCTAPPFQTQYLLNTHKNVHSSTRPHYCPVKGCPRSEGGKGFKRKNEMMRHCLVHDPSGYECPFCVDREHKYPRPDILERHVQVQHMDKSMDDPSLRDVLNQRPGSRGHHRRMRGLWNAKTAP